MKGIQFTVSVLRYLFGRILGPVLPSAYIGPLLTHTFRLDEYRRALQMTTHKSRHRLVKAAFVFD
jgi:hypothetical protein